MPTSTKKKCDATRPPTALVAEYRESEVQHYKGNPLIEALPPPADEGEALEAFGRFPVLDPSERKLPAALRIASVGRLRSYLEPLLCHGELFSNVSWIIREGYVGRNPKDENYLRRLTESYHLALEGKVVPIGDTGCSTAPSIGLFGLSGVGKSTAIERTLSFFPQALLHPELGFSQVVWMKLDCPPDGSLKQLLLNILGELDRHLLSNYERSAKGATIDELILIVANLSRMHHVGALVIDEIQHLVSTKPSSRTKLLNFLITFSNVVRVPVVIAGTVIAKSFLEPNFKFARRFGDGGAFVWNRLDGAEWEFFTEGLFRFRWTRSLIDQRSASQQLYEETQGIHALAVRLFQLCQIDAIRSGAEKITPDQIRLVAKEKFSLVSAALKSLRNGKHRKNFDLDMEGGIASLDSTIEADIKSYNTKIAPQVATNNYQRARALSSLIVLLELDQPAIEELVDDVLKLQPNLKAVDIVQAVMRAFVETSTDQPHENPTMLDLASEMRSANNVQESAGLVDALRASGIISRGICK